MRKSENIQQNKLENNEDILTRCGPTFKFPRQ